MRTFGINTGGSTADMEMAVRDSANGSMGAWLYRQSILRLRAQIGAKIATAKDDDERVMLARRFFEYEAALKRLVGACSDAPFS